jgi:hypothetical protein
MAMVFHLPQVSDTVNSLQQVDSVRSSRLQQQTIPNGNEDTAIGYFPVDGGGLFRIEVPKVARPPVKEIVAAPVTDNPVLIKPPEWNFNANYFMQNGLNAIVSKSKTTGAIVHSYPNTSTAKPESIEIHQRNRETFDWMLGIFLLLTCFFIWIRIYYGKFFSTLGSALISFQIAAKFFREKNVLQRRVSIVLDFIYLVVLSVFIFELTHQFGHVESHMSNFNLFLLFLNMVILYALVRLIVLRGTGFIFLRQSLFSEYITSTFVVNKGAGIALFPIVIIAHYIDKQLVPAILVLGLIVYLTAFIWKTFRAYQIIIRKDVFLFYLILYLCTLEILPFLLGYKVIISLI